jgi:hypothetical protein
MKDWIVETRAVSRRVYLVQAEDEKEAIFTSTHVPPESDEDEYEETMSVVENILDHGGLDRQARNPAGFPDSSGDLASAGEIAGVDITNHRRQVGMPRDAFEWRAFYNASYPKLWGIETTDPAAIDAGLEIVVAPCMPEHAAKDIVNAWNKKTDEPHGALCSKEGLADV